MPIISVIVPVYKVEPYLHKCVDSILMQTFTDFELILVDDGSPDNCGKICDEYAEKDSRVKVIHQENGGLSAARNAGIDWVCVNSSSEWILFVDSDDWIAPTCLEQLYSACIYYNVLISSGGQSSREDEVNNYNECTEPTVLRADDFYEQKDFRLFPITSACCKLFKKNLFDDVRFPVGKFCEDRFTTYKLYFKSNYLACIPEPLYFYRIREGSIFHSKWSPKMLDDLEACEQQLAFFRDNKCELAYRRVCNDYITLIGFYINILKQNGISQNIYYYNFLKRLLKTKLIEYKSVLPDDAGLICYRLAFFSKKNPLSVVYYSFYMLIKYGPRKTFLKIKNREQ